MVKSPDSALLGNSGEALRVAKETYQENTTTEREILEKLINKLISKMNNDQLNNADLKITPLIEVKEDDTEQTSN